MAFVNNNQEIVREEIEQAVWTSTGSPTVEVTWIVLYPGAVSQLTDHFHIISNPFIEPFGLVFFADWFKEGNLFGQVIFYFMNGAESRLLGSHEQICRINLVSFERSNGDSGHWVYLFYTVNFVTPESDTEQIVRIGQINIYCISLDTEIPTV